MWINLKITKLLFKEIKTCSNRIINNKILIKNIKVQANTKMIILLQLVHSLKIQTVKQNLYPVLLNHKVYKANILLKSLINYLEIKKKIKINRLVTKHHNKN